LNGPGSRLETRDLFHPCNFNGRRAKMARFFTRASPTAMSQPQSKFLRTVIERGFLHQCTDLDALDQRILNGTATGYIGFDATADSLHAGSLVPLMLLRWMQKCGLKPIVLMGGGTTKIGDPSGKNEQRQLLTEEQINTNIAGIRKVFEKFLHFGDGPTDALLVNNSEWLDGLQYIDFLREYGRHFSVNRMLTFDSVRLRLEREQPLSFLEFNYSILQSYDFVELARRHGCCLQLGGSDQWGNIVSGVDLGRRAAQAELFGFTTPLLTLASGAKMGKSAGGAVWLNAERLSAYDYWQYWRNADDADVGKLLRLFTELDLSEIERLEKLGGADINSAKIALANAATAMCHDLESAKAAERTALETFTGGGTSEDLPSFEVATSELEAGIVIFDLLRRAGLAKSNGEARRLIKGGGARVNDEQVKDESLTVSAAALTDGGYIKLSAGKKRHVLVRPV
jgi:tyrosyl-tRNA synthetase